MSQEANPKPEGGNNYHAHYSRWKVFSDMDAFYWCDEF